MANGEGYDPFTLSLRSKSPENVRLVLETGVNPNILLKHGWTPLRLAILMNGGVNSIPTVKILLEYGASIHTVDSFPKPILVMSMDERVRKFLTESQGRLTKAAIN